MDLSVVLPWEFRSDVSLPALRSKWAVVVKQFRVRRQNVRMRTSVCTTTRPSPVLNAGLRVSGGRRRRLLGCNRRRIVKGLDAVVQSTARDAQFAAGGFDTVLMSLHRFVDQDSFNDSQLRLQLHWLGRMCLR
jgi:hypothetical protein